MIQAVGHDDNEQASLSIMFPGESFDLCYRYILFSAGTFNNWEHIHIL